MPKMRIKVHEAYTPHWKANDIDDYVHTLWDKDIVKEVISTRYPDYPEITWKLYDNDGNLITIVSLAQDMLHVMRPGHYYSKSLTGWGRAFWQGDQLDNIKNLFDEFKVYDYVPTDGHQPKKNESIKTQRNVTIKVHESNSFRNTLFETAIGSVTMDARFPGVFAFFPKDADGRNDDCTYYFSLQGNFIIQRGWHFGRGSFDPDYIKDDEPWLDSPESLADPDFDGFHDEQYCSELCEQLCKVLGSATY